MTGKHISEVIKDTEKLVTDRRDGLIKPLASPWPKLNRAIMGGFEWGTFAVLGGMSGSGKTAFAAQVQRELHDLNPTEDFIILFFTLEMLAAKVLLRDTIAATRIGREDLLSANGNKITPQQFASMVAYLKSIEGKQIYFIEEAVTPERYIEICDEYYAKYKKKLLVFSDHSLLFEGENRDDDRGMLVQLSKKIMVHKKKNTSIHFLLSQLNRDIERADRRVPTSPMNYPQKSDLFASDSLYQAADYVFMLHRPHLLKFQGKTYGPENQPTDKDCVYIHVLKNREGETKELRFTADFKHMSIIDNI